MLVAPLGGGGLLSGCTIAAKALSRNCRIVGVEPEAGNDGQQSFLSGRIVHIDPPKTIADGVQTQHLGEYTFPIIHRLVDDIVTVGDDELVEAMKFFAHAMKIIVEPTGCLAAAAILGKKIDVAGKRVGIVVSGGNVDLLRFTSLVSQGQHRQAIELTGLAHRYRQARLRLRFRGWRHDRHASSPHRQGARHAAIKNTIPNLWVYVMAATHGRLARGPGSASPRSAPAPSISQPARPMRCSARCQW